MSGSQEKVIEKTLEKLGKQLRAGAAKLHPVTEKELAAVREALKQQSIEQTQDRGRGKEKNRGR